MLSDEERNDFGVRPVVIFEGIFLGHKGAIASRS